MYFLCKGTTETNYLRRAPSLPTVGTAVVQDTRYMPWRSMRKKRVTSATLPLGLQMDVITPRMAKGVKAKATQSARPACSLSASKSASTRRGEPVSIKTTGKQSSCTRSQHGCLQPGSMLNSTSSRYRQKQISVKYQTFIFAFLIPHSVAPQRSLFGP